MMRSRFTYSRVTLKWMSTEIDWAVQRRAPLLDEKKWTWSSSHIVNRIAGKREGRYVDRPLQMSDWTN